MLSRQQREHERRLPCKQPISNAHYLSALLSRLTASVPSPFALHLVQLIRKAAVLFVARRLLL